MSVKIKNNKDSLIAVELSKFEKKLNEIQRYLLENIIDSDMHPDIKYKEVDMQIKMMNNVLQWLPTLERLRETDSTKKIEIRGGQEVNGMFKTMIDERTK